MPTFCKVHLWLEPVNPQFARDAMLSMQCNACKVVLSKLTKGYCSATITDSEQEATAALLSKCPYTAKFQNLSASVHGEQDRKS